MNKNQIIEDYLNLNSLKFLAKKYSTSRYKIRQILTQNDVPIRKKTFHYSPPFTAEKRKLIAQEYLNGESSAKLSIKYNTYSQNILNFVEQQGYKTRRQKRYIETPTHKICNKCSNYLPITEFQHLYNRKGINIGLGHCKECAKKIYQKNKTHIRTTGSNRRKRQSQENWAKYRFSRLKKSAKTRNLTFTITLENFSEWFSQQKLNCKYCNLTRKQIETLPKNRLSIDRMDNSIGYELSNLAICCLFCNKIKNNIFTCEEMIEVGIVIRKIFLKKLKSELDILIL